jgi:hypothetical protein
MLHNSNDLRLRTTNKLDRLLGMSVITGSFSDLDRARILAGADAKYIPSWL